MKVLDDGKTNPLLVIEAEEVAAWLLSKAYEAGYGDRGLSAVQVQFDGPEGGHYVGVPRLVAMVSNIPNSRAKPEPA